MENLFFSRLTDGQTDGQSANLKSPLAKASSGLKMPLTCIVYKEVTALKLNVKNKDMINVLLLQYSHYFKG